MISSDPAVCSVGLTLHGDGRDEDDRKRQQEVILDQTSRSITEIQLADVERRIQAVHDARHVVARHTRQNLVHGFRDILTGLVAEERGDIRVEECVIRQIGPARAGIIADRVQIIAQVVDFRVVDRPLPVLSATSPTRSPTSHQRRPEP